jgi:hypothetical protein
MALAVNITEVRAPWLIPGAIPPDRRAKAGPAAAMKRAIE